MIGVGIIIAIILLVFLWRMNRSGEAARGNGLDGLDQACVIVSPATHIDFFRNWPQAQKVIRRGPLEFCAGRSS